MSMKEHVMYAYTTLQYSFNNSRVTPFSGLLILGQMLSAIDFDHKVDRYTPPAQNYSNSDVLKSMLIGILCGNPDFEAIHETDDDLEFFCNAFHMRHIPSEATMLQRMDEIGDSLQDTLRQASVSLSGSLVLSRLPLRMAMSRSISMSAPSSTKNVIRKASQEPTNVRTDTPRSLPISGRKDTLLRVNCGKENSIARKIHRTSLSKYSALPGRLRISHSCSTWIPAMIPLIISVFLWKNVLNVTAFILSSSATSAGSFPMTGWRRSAMHAQMSGNHVRGRRNI